MSKTAYENINIHEVVTMKLCDGSNLVGEVLGKDTDWISIINSDDEVWSISKNAIVAFSTQY